VCVCTPRQRKDLLCECREGVRGLAPVCDTLTRPEDSPYYRVCFVRVHMKAFCIVYIGNIRFERVLNFM
jgi:hypothetical protein